MGYSDPGYMGGEARTPNLDRLSEEGMTFLNLFNNAKCAPSRAALKTGMSSQRVKAFRSAGNIAENGAVCVAELLAENGYATIISGKWHIRPDPLDVGFQRRMGVNPAPYYFKPRLIPGGKKLQPLYLEREQVDFETLPDDWYSTTAYTDYAIRAITEEALEEEKPFFLYLAVNAPHAPLSAPKEDIDRYDGVYDKGLPAIRKQRYERMVERGIVDPKSWKLPDYESDRTT
jgi:arylsulfatase